jgi:hypothetical protein
MSCINPAAYTYDANGHQRWCSDCGAELGPEQSWHPDGGDVPWWAVAALAAAGVFVVLAVVSLVLGIPYG